MSINEEQSHIGAGHMCLALDGEQPPNRQKAASAYIAEIAEYAKIIEKTKFRSFIIERDNNISISGIYIYFSGTGIRMDSQKAAEIDFITSDEIMRNLEYALSWYRKVAEHKNARDRFSALAFVALQGEPAIVIEEKITRINELVRMIRKAGKRPREYVIFRDVRTTDVKDIFRIGKRLSYLGECLTTKTILFANRQLDAAIERYEKQAECCIECRPGRIEKEIHKIIEILLCSGLRGTFRLEKNLFISADGDICIYRRKSGERFGIQYLVKILSSANRKRKKALMRKIKSILKGERNE